MATTYTQYYNLGKQTDHADKFSMDVITDNADKIDAALHEQAVGIAEVTSDEAFDRAALAPIIDSGAKNRLVIRDIEKIKSQNTGGVWTGNVYVFRGVTYTIHDDFSITATGTATGGNANLILSEQGGFSIEQGEWVLSGCPSGGSSSTYNITIQSTASDTGSTAEFSSCSAALARIYILEGAVADNLVFKPMVCSKAAYEISPEYQPYRLSNEERLDTDRAALVQIIDSGPKNTCKLGFTSKAATSGNPSITNNGTSITLNGSRSASSASILVYDLVGDESLSQDTRYTLPAGKYICKGTGNSSVRVQVFAHSGTAESLQKLSDSKDNNEFEYTSSLKQDYPYLCFRIWIAGSSTFDNVTIYPMICSKAAWNISQAYQPYRPSYQEMYDMILAL